MICGQEPLQYTRFYPISSLHRSVPLSFFQRSTVPFHKPLKGPRHPAFGYELRCGKGYLHRQFSALFINFPARFLPVDLLVKGPKHGTTLPSQLFLKSPVQVRCELADASIPGAHGRSPSVKNTKDQDSRGQSSAHASGRSPFHSFFVCLDRSTPSMKSGGHLRRIRFDLQFENLCDRREDGFASVVSLLSILFGQPACSLRKGREPAGLHLISQGCPPI